MTSDAARPRISPSGPFDNSVPFPRSSAAQLRQAVLSDVPLPASATPDHFVRFDAPASIFAVDQSSSLFTLSDNAVITYAGDETRRALITAAATIEIGAANSGSFIRLAIDHNGDTVGQAIDTAPAFAAGQIFARALGAATMEIALATTRVVTLAAGETLSPVFAVTYAGTPADLAGDGLTFSVLLL